ncbi:PREDICTED: uncharacterized protein LOC108609489 [Drosophila arizonae]|uniref:Uncharacterized protein LOC108609489 n=1 Tax=Drosophila arizonae TaxID=7263 RepID=A0ABM1NP12_DROAR|nr:PREDICTED: uncharacterized protein LOC108609489 [Drosophila arizonae]
MKSLTLCLLLLVCGSCLLGSNANTINDNSVHYEEVELYSDDGFIKTMEKILMKVLTTVRGVNCTIKTVADILIATTKYVDSIDVCGMAVPKEVAKIVKCCKDIIAICEDIIHLNSTICAAEENGKMTSGKCFWKLFEAIMKLTRKLNTALKLIAKLPGDTEACFVDATNEVVESYDNFLPNINKCIDEM